MATKAARKSGSGSGQLASFLKIKAGEGRAVFLLGFAMLATEAGFWLGGNGVDGLVFNKLPVDQTYPYLLILKGVLAFFAISLYNTWLVRVNKTRLLVATSLITIIVLAALRSVFYLNADPPTLFYIILLPVTYIIPDLLGLQVWFLAREVFDSRQSKRLFPLITAVGVVGIVGGNFLTIPLTGRFRSEDLITIWAVLVLFAFLALYSLRRRIDKQQKKIKRRKDQPRRREEAESVWSRLRLGYTFVRYYRIIWLLALSVALTQVLYYVLWLFFIQAAKEQYPNNPEELASFFGVINGTATLVASLLSLFVANRLFATIGVRNVLLGLPLVDLLSCALLLVTPAFGPVMITRYAQMIVKDGLNNSASETLYNLIPAETRDVASTFNKAVSQQGGIIVAGLLLLLAVPLGPAPLLMLGVLLSLAYLVITWQMRARYRATLVALLKEGQQEFFNSEENNRAFIADTSTSSGDDPLAIAINNLSDSSEGTRRLSAELLGKIGSQEGVKPLIRTLLTDPSPEVRRTAIVSLKELDINRALPNIAEAMTDWDAGVRAEAAVALREAVTHSNGNGSRPDSNVFYYLRKGLEDSNPTVKREAAVTMASFGRKGEALWILWDMGRSSDASVRREAAAAYGLLRDRVLVKELIEMLDDADPQVRRQAAEALGHLPTRQAIAALLNAFGDDNPAVRETSAHSLALMRAQAGRVVLQYLFNTESTKGQQAALHALSLAKMYEQQETTAQRWADRSDRLHSHVNGASADAGNELALRPVATTFDLALPDQERLLTFGRNQIALAARLKSYIQSLKELNLPPITPDAPLQLARRARRNPENLLLLNRSLKERYDAAILRAVSIVGLLGNVEAITLVASGLQADGRNAARMRADAIETLENLGDSRLTPALVGLLEQRDDEEEYTGKSLSEILIEIWMEGDDWLRACVLHVIGMFDLRKLAPLVDQVLEADFSETDFETEAAEVDPWVEEAAMEAQQRLSWPRDDRELNRMLEKSLSEKDMQTLGTLSTMSRILFLQKVPMFANLSPEDLRRVALVSRERLFSPNEIICYEGDPGDELYIVVSGRVQVIVGYGDSGAKTVAIMGEGESLGEMAILDDIPRTATLRAYGGPVRLLTLSADEFKRILRERPELAVEVIRVFSRWLREANKKLQSAPSALDNLSQTQQLTAPVNTGRRG